MQPRSLVKAVPVAAATPSDGLHSLKSGLSDAVRLVVVDGSPAPRHLSTEVRAGWSKEFLFLRFDAAFSFLRTAPGSVPVDAHDGRTPSLWEQSDVLECYIGYDARVNQRYGEFQVAPDGRWTSIDVRHREDTLDADYYWKSGMKCLSVVDNDASMWRVVMQIPLSSLGVSGRLGEELHGNFFRATGRYHGDELLAWSPTGPGRGCFHRPQFFGTIQLAGL